MKRLFTFWTALLITCIASAQVSTWDGTWEPWTHGTGTEADPFLIENAQQLAYLAYRVNNGLDANGTHISNHDYHYKMMIDVDLNGSETFQWTPIGYWNSDSDYQCFGGHFDGNNHTISGMYINSSANRVGFFGNTDCVSVKNLFFEGNSVTGAGANIYAGGIIGYACGETHITNCHNTGSVAGRYCGGIAGALYNNTTNNTHIANSNNNGNITGNGTSGGILGLVSIQNNNSNIIITNCCNLGNVMGFNMNSNGGIVGNIYYNCHSSNSVITNCYNIGSVSSDYGNASSSGIAHVGYNSNCNDNNTIITNCYNIGDVISSNNGGIVIGYYVAVNNSYYLNSCGGNNTYGGQPMSADAMKTQEFVETLNAGLCAWEYDYNNINSGYPVLTGVLVTLTTHDATNITQSQANLHGALEVENTGVHLQGFEYKKTTDSNYQTVNVSGSGNISATISGLTPNTEYTYRVFCAPEDCGTYYGEEKTFTTQSISVTTNDATNVTQSHATLHGHLDFGDARISEQGFQYKKASDSDYQTVILTGGGDISTTLTDLIYNTQYHYRAYCKPRGCDPVYGQLKTFTTLPISVITNNATNVTSSSATLHGSISIGDATLVSKGFEYRAVGDQDFTTINVAGNDNDFTAQVIGLTVNTTYEYRAFMNIAENATTYYGDTRTFEVSWLNSDTICIQNADMLRWVSEQCNSGTTFEGKYIKLMNDITLPLNVPNNMISIGSYPNHPFKGTFDGNGKHIYNLYIDQPNTPYQGFFGYTLNANLYNVGLVNITASGRNYTGGMVAYAENTHLRDCYVNGGTLFALSYCGGLIGYQQQGTNSIVSGCYNTCSVSGNHYVGGLIGFSNYSTVRNSYVAGPVSGQGDGIGAIIGGANEVLMYYCYFSTELTGQTNAIGENNYKDGEGLTNAQMRDPQFVATLNQGLVTPVWVEDYASPINNGFPIIKWQRPGTGVDENVVAKNDVSLYPNPANDFITIQSDSPNVSLKHMEVYDAMGRRVMSEILDGPSYEIGVTKLQAGFYCVRIQTDNGGCSNIKLVVQ